MSGEHCYHYRRIRMVSDGAENDTITRPGCDGGWAVIIEEQAFINNKSPNQIINSSLEIVRCSRFNKSLNLFLINMMNKE